MQKKLFGYGYNSDCRPFCLLKNGRLAKSQVINWYQVKGKGLVMRIRRARHVDVSAKATLHA